MFNRPKPEVSQLQEELAHKNEKIYELKQKLLELSMVVTDYKINQIVGGLYCFDRKGKKARVFNINGEWFLFNSMGSQIFNGKKELPNVMVSDYYNDLKYGISPTKEFLYGYMKKNGYVIANNLEV